MVFEEDGGDGSCIVTLTESKDKGKSREGKIK